MTAKEIFEARPDLNELLHIKKGGESVFWLVKDRSFAESLEGVEIVGIVTRGDDEQPKKKKRRSRTKINKSE
jgi:hypothetical protein